MFFLSSAWLGGSWVRSNFWFPNSYVLCYLHHSIFPFVPNLDSLCYPIQQLFQPFCQKAPNKSVLLCFCGSSAWDSEEKCACDELKFFLLNIKIVMGRRKEAINILLLFGRPHALLRCLKEKGNCLPSAYICSKHLQSSLLIFYWSSL